MREPAHQILRDGIAQDDSGGFRSAHARLRDHLSDTTGLSKNSSATATGDLGTSGMNHFTLPALISSWAMRHGFRELVLTIGRAPD
jgi:hypothetical protein